MTHVHLPLTETVLRSPLQKPGMPANQIVLGVASYGHSFGVSPSDAFVRDSNTGLAVYPRFNSSNHSLGDSWEDIGSVDTPGLYEGPGGSWNFWGLVKGGFLTTDGNPAPGTYHRYDACSHTVGGLTTASYFLT